MSNSQALTSSKDANGNADVADVNIADVAIDNLADTAQILKDSGEELASNTHAVANQTGEAVRQIARQTSQNLESTTNQTLEFFGVPIDVQTLLHSAMEWGGKFIWALIIFFVGKWIGRRLVNVAVGLIGRSQMDATAANFLSNVLYGLMLVMVTLAALNKLGINTNSFVAVLGAVGVAIGVALKDQLGNLAAGVMIVIFRPFGRGDYVEVGGKVGTVMDITLVNTRIKTPSNHEVIIPNGDIMTSASINYTSLPNRRIEQSVSISYDNDINTARQLILSVVREHDKIFATPEPVVRVTNLGDNGVELTLYAWTDNHDWWATQCEILERIKYCFDDNAIIMPYPQRAIHVKNSSLPLSIDDTTKTAINNTKNNQLL